MLKLEAKWESLGMRLHYRRLPYGTLTCDVAKSVLLNTACSIALYAYCSYIFLFLSCRDPNPEPRVDGSNYNLLPQTNAGSKGAYMTYMLS